jgi:D-alanine-D-alanine ligase
VLASAIAMDKPMAKGIFAAAGLPLAEGVVVASSVLAERDVIERPFVVKPINEGSSVGVRIVGRDDNSWAAEARDWSFGAQVLVERYIPGREITAAIMGDRALGALEIRPAKGALYDYAAKYAPGGSIHLVPAPIHPQAYAAALDIALRAHRALGCRGVTRADLRYDDTAGEPGRLVLLEINTQPGMTPTSLVPEIAQHAGLDFAALVRWMTENAACDS